MAKPTVTPKAKTLIQRQPVVADPLLQFRRGHADLNSAVRAARFWGQDPRQVREVRLACADARQRLWGAQPRQARLTSMDPTLTFDVIHAELSLTEFIAFAREGFALFGQGLAFIREAFCGLPFVDSC